MRVFLRLNIKHLFDIIKTVVLSCINRTTSARQNGGLIMRIIGKLTDDQVRAFKAAGLRINYVKPRFSNVLAFPRQASNQELPKAA